MVRSEGPERTPIAPTQRSRQITGATALTWPSGVSPVVPPGEYPSDELVPVNPAHTHAHTPPSQLTGASQLPQSFTHFQHSICYKQKLLMRLLVTGKPNHHVFLAENMEPSA